MVPSRSFILIALELLDGVFVFRVRVNFVYWGVNPLRIRSLDDASLAQPGAAPALAALDRKRTLRARVALLRPN